MSVEFRGITRRYGRKTALDGLDLVVEPKSFTVVCGPPGSGKSALFRMLVGLEKPDEGVIVLDGRDITADPPAARPIGYVPQSFALYPHLSVADNMAYPLALARTPKAEIATRVARTAGILSITHLLKKTPDQLSGGEKQRVAVARGLLKNASLFVLDDPLVGLDYKLRERLMDELKTLREELGATFLYATSDSLEALTMAQRLAVLDGGRIIQHDTAENVYTAPARARVMDLIGFPHANLIPATLSEGGLSAGPLRFDPRGGAQKTTTAAIVGVRPEAIRIGAIAGEAQFPARVTLVENLGGEAVIYLDAAGQSLTATMPLSGIAPPVLDSEVTVSVDPADAFLFDAATGERLALGGAA